MLGQRHFQPYPAEIPGISSGTSPPAPGSFAVVVFRPGGVQTGNVFTTYSAALAAVSPGGTIVTDASLVGGLAHTGGGLGVLDLTGIRHASYHVQTFGLPTETIDNLVIDDGTTLNRACFFDYFMGIVCASKTAPSLQYITAAGINDNIILRSGSALVMDPSATTPAIVIPAGGEFDLEAYFAFLGAPGSTVPVLFTDGGAGSASGINAYDLSVVDPSFAGSAIPSTFTFGHDMSVPFVVQTFILGGQTDNRQDLEQWMLPIAGSTAAAPAPPFVMTGQHYWNTDLNTELTFDGTSYVGPTFFGNATGAAPTVTAGATLGLRIIRGRMVTGNCKMMPTDEPALGVGDALVGGQMMTVSAIVLVFGHHLADGQMKPTDGGAMGFGVALVGGRMMTDGGWLLGVEAAVADGQIVCVVHLVASSSSLRQEAPDALSSSMASR